MLKWKAKRNEERAVSGPRTYLIESTNNGFVGRVSDRVRRIQARTDPYDTVQEVKTALEEIEAILGGQEHEGP